MDHSPETLHLCCVIRIHCIKFSLNLCSPSNHLLKLSKYYWKWLRVLFNMGYIFFRAGDVRTYVTYGPNKLALWCFHNKGHELASPAWTAGRHFEMRIQNFRKHKRVNLGSQCTRWTLNAVNEKQKTFFKIPYASRLRVVFPKCSRKQEILIDGKKYV